MDDRLNTDCIQDTWELTEVTVHRKAVGFNGTIVEMTEGMSPAVLYNNTRKYFALNLTKLYSLGQKSECVYSSR
jgi:hypothetical protein